jgi:ATP-dependent Clp protease ATP-binding subunit ClpA
MDEGFITNSKGKKADCRNSIVILTSNLGAVENEKNQIGFSLSLDREGEDDNAVRDFFRPEFRNRLDSIVKFKKLNEEHIEKIVHKLIDEINDLLSEKNISLSLTNSAISYLIREGYDKKLGARPMARKINELIKVPLSKKIIFEKINNCNIKVNFTDKIEFNITDKEFIVFPTNKVIDDNGYVILDQVKSNC